MRPLCFAIALLLLVNYCAAIRCYDKETSRVRVSGKGWQDKTDDNGYCTSNKWCAKITGGGQKDKTDSSERQEIMNGSFQTCVSDLGASIMCEDIGTGCKTSHPGFMSYSGDITVCCCQTDLCNATAKTFVSLGLLTALLILQKLIA